jgi:hypothetical protein
VCGHSCPSNILDGPVYSPRLERGYYGTPYGGGPQYGSGGGDQYGYGPAYSYAKQAPEPPTTAALHLATGLERAILASRLRVNTSTETAYWVKVKNPKAPAVKREAEEDWGRSGPFQFNPPVASRKSNAWPSIPRALVL